MRTGDAVVGEAPLKAWFFWRRPPGWFFHGVLAAVTVALLVACSYPGVVFFLWLGSALFIGVLAFVWAVRAVAFWIARRRSVSAGSARWFLLAPLGGLMTALLVAGGVPLQVRWATSRAAFEEAAAEALHASEVEWDGARRVGTYQIVGVRVTGDAVIFYEQTGSFIDVAGFAYLPRGPAPELETEVFERPRFRHLGGPWYAWTASW